LLEDVPEEAVSFRTSWTQATWPCKFFYENRFLSVGDKELLKHLSREVTKFGFAF
jgi:hypothetical protein